LSESRVIRPEPWESHTSEFYDHLRAEIGRSFRDSVPGLGANAISVARVRVLAELSGQSLETCSDAGYLDFRASNLLSGGVGETHGIRKKILTLTSPPEIPASTLSETGTLGSLSWAAQHT
jgi:hypothetical protein